MSARIAKRPMASWMIILTLIAAMGCAAQAPAPAAKAPAPAAAPAPAPASAPVAAAPAGPPQHDLLDAVLWMQKSVEYKAATMGAYALAQLRLDQALVDPNWTALVPKEQPGNYQSLPPAVILDLDETALDNSGYQAWNAIKDTTFDSKTWTTYVNSETSLPIPGSVDFVKYAASKGVKVFYITNRTAEEEPATRKVLEKYGYPLDSTMDTVLTSREKPDWTSAKSTRRAYVAKDYRVLLNLGDNFGDFVDEYRGTEAERLTVMEQYRDRWGKQWIMLPNPTYGSFESAPYKHDFKLSEADKRKAKRDALQPWPGP